MSIPPTIPPPPDDQYEKSPRSRMAGFINGITGGGNPRLNQIMQEDHERKMHDLNMHREAAHQYSQILISGISPQTGKALTDEERRNYEGMQRVAQTQYEKVAGVNPEAKDILGKLGTVVKHVMGKKDGWQGGQGGQGGGSAPPAAGGSPPPTIPPPPGAGASPAPAASAAPPTPPAGSTPPFVPPGTASTSPAKQGVALAQAGTPPPAPADAGPSTLSSSSMPPPQLSPSVISQGAPILGTQLGTQMKLAEEQKTREQELAANTANIVPAAQATFTAASANNPLALQKKQLQEAFPELTPDQLEYKFGLIPKNLKKAWTMGPNGPYSQLVNPLTNQPIEGTENFNEVPPPSLMSHIKTGEFSWTDGEGNLHRTATTTTTSPVMPKGRPASIPAPPGGSARSGGASSAVTKAATSTPANASGSPAPVRVKGDRIIGSVNRLSPPAQTVIMKTDPVLKQVDGLIKRIDDLKLGDDNTSGYLLPSRLGYAFGHASPNGELGKDIAGLSLGSLVEAASALQGASRSIAALHIAMEHTPNAWVDSPKLIKEKLQTIKARLQDVVDDANTLGMKYQQPQGAQGRRGAVPPPMMPPRTAEEYLQSIHAQ